MTSNRSYSLSELVTHLGGELHDDNGVRISAIAPLERAGEGQLAFVAQAKYRKAIQTTQASALILPPDLAHESSLPRIVVADPYLYFARVAQLLYPMQRPVAGIHASAVVESKIPASVSVGAMSYIGPDCEIGENVVIGPGSNIASNVSIGADTWLYPSVSIYTDCKLGERCIVHAGAVIGSDGFGFAPDKAGAKQGERLWEKIPQVGGVRIGDDVEIGANTTIDRGALTDTIIASGVKLDNLVHIAHNCELGEDTAIAALAGLAGSAKIGRRVMIGGQTGIIGHIEITDDVIVSGRSFISKSVNQKDVFTSLIPAQPHTEWMKNSVHLRHLHDMMERIKTLEKKLAQMENKA